MAAKTLDHVKRKEGIVSFQLNLVLPDSLFQEAESRGLLTSETFETLLRQELRHHHIDQLFVIADQLASLPLPPLTDEEIETEIQAVRTERHTSHESRY
jgi:hypothetical protein